MTKNPFINALLALSYIVAISSFMFYGLSHSHPDNSVFAPIAFLSLLTLSATIMAYVLLYQPLIMVLDRNKKKGINLFIQTIAVFAGGTFILLLLLFLGILK